MSATPATIASAALPPRVRRILRSFFEHIATDVVQSLNAMLPEYEQALFKQAEQARNNNRQAEFFSNLHSFQRNRGEFVPHFIFALESELASVRTPPGESSAPVSKVEFRTLTLVEDDVMDEEIVLRDIARRHEIRAAHALLLLGQRFGALGGAPAFDNERLPIGPQALCRMLKQAGATLELELEERLLLYRTFDHKVMGNYHEWAETLNQYLSREGVLPGLVYTPRRVRSVDTPGTSPRAGTRPEGQTAAERPLTAWRGPSTPSAWTVPDLKDLPKPPPLPDAPGGAAAASGEAAPTAPATTGEDGQPNFEGLQQLLAARRKAMARFSGPAAARLGEAGAIATASKPGAVEMPRKLVPTADVLSSLDALQAAPAQPRGKDQPRRNLKDIQQALLSRARQQHGAQATLASPDADTFELLGLLYTEMEREVRADAPASDLLGRLQVPLVQAALRDRQFFLRPQHPARELLNAVAESGATWQSEDDLDPQLLHHLHQAVEFVVKHYHGDEAVFEQANQDVQRHLQAAARKAELAERRQVEAARGKERLEIAKQRANETIESALAEAQPPRFVQALLNQAWADVLTLTQLRQGEKSDEWAEHLQTTLQIVAATTGDAGAQKDAQLPAKIEKALQQVGYHEDEAQAIAKRLSSADVDDDAGSKTELTARLKARARLGEQNLVKRKPAAPRTPKEQECYDYLRSLPFGTWFEFVLNQQGDVQRQRLSWFSPVTGNALFVNQRGQRVGEHSLDGLAMMMAKNQAHIVTEDKGRLIDRAWNATLRALRNLAGMSKPAEEGAGA
ncbi:DUF1631 domain-containing protein [Pseudoxanthomonas indica]|uniref:DUF1631 domain-containing protein n=1 Tax=Pseudoxanthomonas indica TaxID=428993 RepID=UPI001E5BA990|nr:DUF1631 domain-containing protein [Pseudoxanthomonas indica]